MNKYDVFYEIRRVRLDEIDELKQYIGDKWKINHILKSDEELFRHEYVFGDKVNFLIAKNKDTDDIVGMIGYIPASDDLDYLDIWPTMWKVNEDTLPLLGVEMYKRLYNLTGARNVLGCGNNHSTASIMLNVVMKYKTMKMKHYYVISDRGEYKIAIINHPINRFKLILNVDNTPKIKIIRTPSEIRTYLSNNINLIPYKDANYYIRRYLSYPIYDYIVYGIEEAHHKALLVGRIEEYNGSKALRLVDFAGEDMVFASLSNFFADLIKEYEYIDFYEYGMDDDCIVKAGFYLLQDDDLNIIPNYFSPFEPKNIDIWVSSPRDVEARFFKADGDQDRPSRRI